MPEIITVGLDLAKSVFQLHGADASGRAVLRKKLSLPSKRGHCHGLPRQAAPRAAWPRSPRSAAKRGWTQGQPRLHEAGFQVGGSGDGLFGPSS